MSGVAFDKKAVFNNLGDTHPKKSNLSDKEGNLRKSGRGAKCGSKWWVLIWFGHFENQAQQWTFAGKSHFRFHACYKTEFA